MCLTRRIFERGSKSIKPEVDFLSFLKQKDLHSHGFFKNSFFFIAYFNEWGHYPEFTHDKIIRLLTSHGLKVEKNTVNMLYTQIFNLVIYFIKALMNLIWSKKAYNILTGCFSNDVKR